MWEEKFMRFEEKQIQNMLKVLAASVHEQSLPKLETPDWGAMIDLLTMQNLQAVAAETLAAYPDFRKHEKYKQVIYSAARIGADQDVRTKEFLRIYQALTSKELYPIVVKGICCRSLYGMKGSYRLSGDEDILIKIEDFYAIKAVFEENGYQIMIDPEATSYESEEIFAERLQLVQEVPFVNPHNGLKIEVHINPFGTRNLINQKMNSFFNSSFDRMIEWKLDGVSIRSFSHTEHLLFLIFHAFKHFIYSGFGLRMVLDILLYADIYGDKCDWGYIYKALETVNADKFYSDLIHIGNDYLGFTLAAWKEKNCPNELLKDMIESGVFGNMVPERTIAAVFTTAALNKVGTKKKSGKGQWLKNFLFPDTAWLYAENPEIKRKPWLAIPAYYARIKRGVFYLMRNRTKLASDGLKIGKARVELLEQYGIIK